MDIINIIGAVTYGGMASIRIDGQYLNNVSLQFHNGTKWIFNYAVYNWNNKFPMIIAKETEKKCCVVNDEEEMKRVGKLILKGDDSFLNKDIIIQKRSFKNDNDKNKFVLNNKNVFWMQDSAVFDNLTYVFLIKY